MTEPSRLLTLATLKDKGACVSGLKQFRNMFGDSVEVTEEVARAYPYPHTANWVADHLLSHRGWASFVEGNLSLWINYEETVCPLWEAHEKGEALLGSHPGPGSSPHDSYYAKRNALWDEYAEGERAAQDIYGENAMALFARIYIAEGETP